MLVVDIAEDKKVINRLTERLGKDGFRTSRIGRFDCKEKYFPIKTGYCVDEDEMEILAKSNIDFNKGLCASCDKRRFIRFADFTNDTKSFFYERKTVVDFISSRRGRLYSQLNKIDTYVSGRKGLILEGVGEYVPIQDSKWWKVDKKRLQSLSPLQQVIELGGKKEWTMSFIRELKMRDMEFVQTYNLDETIDFLIQCDEGYDKEPKLRAVPKRRPELSLEQNILILFDDVGLKRSTKILEDYGSLANLIKELRKIKNGNKFKHKIFKQLYEVFINGEKGKSTS